MNSRSSSLSLILILLSLSSKAAAYEFSLSLGQYKFADGVVNNVFKNDQLAWLLRVGVPRDDGLSWSTTLMHYNFESRVAFLENNVRLLGLQTGFRKSFRDESRSYFGVEPFFGASLGITSMEVKPENENTETSYNEKSKDSFSSFWEVGVQLVHVGIKNLDLELKITDLAIDHKLLGDMNMGGRILSFGVQYRYPAN